MCTCAFTIAGITVLPVRSTRAAPRGAIASARSFAPTFVTRPFSTTNALDSTTVPSPTRSRAPAYTTGGDAPRGCEKTTAAHDVATIDAMSSGLVICNSLPRDVEHRVVGGNRAERVRRRARADGKISLHGGRERVEVRFQDLGLRFVGDRTHRDRLAAEAADERHLAARERVARPLRVPARRHEIAAAVVLEHVHRRRVDAAGLAPAHLQQHVVPHADAGAHEQPEDAVEESLDDAR